MCLHQVKLLTNLWYWGSDRRDFSHSREIRECPCRLAPCEPGIEVRLWKQYLCPFGTSTHNFHRQTWDLPAATVLPLAFGSSPCAISIDILSGYLLADVTLSLLLFPPFFLAQFSSQPCCVSATLPPASLDHLIPSQSPRFKASNISR